MNNFKLSLNDLKKGRLGITPNFGACLSEAASVCLDERKHTSGTTLLVDGVKEVEFKIVWSAVTSQMKRTWADDEVATENGAYGIAILILEQLTDLTVVKRSKKGTGFDYWLGFRDDEEPLFQNKGSLEVSGIRNGSMSDIRSRTKQKIEQTNLSDDSLPTYISVVEYSKPRTRFIKK